jgi:hypothetical protein
MAVRENATTDGLNLDQVPPQLKGVTCFFCHDVASVGDVHNDPLVLASDIVMRGPFSDPVANTAHPAGYSAFHDSRTAASSKFCGACHDIVNGHGVAIERTYDEWQHTVFATHPQGGDTCGQCHMYAGPNLVPIAQAPGVFSRPYHPHDFPAVDVALAAFPQTDSQKQSVQSLLDTTLHSELCVGQGTAGIHVVLENVGAGHGWPSGAAQDRRAWVEVKAYAAGNMIYQSGAVADGTSPTVNPDPDLWLLRDCMLDAQGNQVSMFWQAALPSESYQLPGQVTFNNLDPAFYASHIYRTFPKAAALPAVPDRVTMRVRLQPIGLDVIDDLVASGDLDSAVRASIPSFDMGPAALVEWTPSNTKSGSYSYGGVQFTCVTNTNLNPASCLPGTPDSCVPAPAHVHCNP